MPDKNSSMEKAYEDALAGKDAAKAEAKAKTAMVAKEQAFAKKKKAAPLDPNFGMPAAKKPSPAKGMPY